MLILPALLAAVAAATVAFVVLWSNPQRRINVAAFWISLNVTAWLLCRTFSGVAEYGFFWMRVTIAVGAFIPMQLANLLYAIRYGSHPPRRIRTYLLIWFVACGGLASIAFTDWFIPPDSTPETRLIGMGYYVYTVGQLGCYGLLFAQTLLSLRECTGVQKIECRVMLLGSISAAALVLFLMILQRGFRLNMPLHVPVLIVFAQFAAVITAITTHRIFEARHLFLLAANKVVLVLTVAVIAWISYDGMGLVLPPYLALIGATAIALNLSTWISRRLDRLLLSKFHSGKARSEAFELARQTLDQARLERGFRKILSAWANTEDALILVRVDGGFTNGSLTFAPDDPAFSTLQEIEWVTPERLQRERPTEDRLALSRFLDERKLGALVYCEGPILHLVIGVGVRASRRPYTYPDIQQLLEVAAIIESSFDRALLLGKAQRAEQLATVGLLGASVAHEIRNPLVTVKSFVHLLPQHYDDAAFRDRFFRLINEEVERIDRLTVQLLDLAAPRKYRLTPTPLHQVILGSLELVATKADERYVSLHRELDASPDMVMTDASATRQLLLNLCFNGIQAQEGADGERWVRIATRKVSRGVELAISDNGPGIPEDNRSQLFQAFQSTKSSGFGLGLAICSEIVSSLDATITIDPFVRGQGAVFRIVFPCPPPIS